MNVILESFQQTSRVCCPENLCTFIKIEVADMGECVLSGGYFGLIGSTGCSE